MYDVNAIEIINIEATSYCNARCPQCLRFNDKNEVIVPLQHLPLKTIQKINKKSLPRLKKVSFEGDTGDVLNHPDALEIAQSFEDVDDLIFFTNASIRNVKFFKELAQIKNMTIVFSVDGLEDTNHLYRQNTNFKKIMANAEAYISAGGNAVWKYIIFEHNQHQLDEATKRSYEMGFKNFLSVNSDRSWYNGNSWPVYNQGVYQFDLRPSTQVNNREKLESDHTTLEYDIIEKEKILQLPMKCPNHEQNEIYMEINGNILPCCMLAQDWWNPNFNTKSLFQLLKKSGSRSINLNHHSLEEIFNSKFYVDTLPNSLKHKPMPKCVHYCGKCLS